MVEYWIIPCNVNQFNVIEHFKANNKVVWKNQFSIKKGDVVYIYIGKPYGEIKYKCIAINDAVDDKLLEKNPYAIVKTKSKNYFIKKTKYVQLELVEAYNDSKLSYSELIENGLGQVQIQARMSRELKKYIEDLGY